MAPTYLLEIERKGEFVLNSIRVRFTRGDNVKFISHLDLMKLFERTIRRTGLPIAHSQGFNPHPQMVFGLPLSVGVTSEAEYADFELIEYMEPSKFKERMNRELPAGILITEAVERTGRNNIMASISGAVYEITVFLKENLSMEQLNIKLDSFLKNEVIMVKKEGKGGIRDIDIKPMIHKLELYPVNVILAGYEEFETIFGMKSMLSAGSIANLKPELLLAAFAVKSDIKIGTARIHRKELFVDVDGKTVNPLAG